MFPEKVGNNVPQFFRQAAEDLPFAAAEVKEQSSDTTGVEILSRKPGASRKGFDDGTRSGVLECRVAWTRLNRFAGRVHLYM